MSPCRCPGRMTARNGRIAGLLRARVLVSRRRRDQESLRIILEAHGAGCGRRLGEVARAALGSSPRRAGERHPSPDETATRSARAARQRAAATGPRDALTGSMLEEDSARVRGRYQPARQPVSPTCWWGHRAAHRADVLPLPRSRFAAQLTPHCVAAAPLPGRPRRGPEVARQPGGVYQRDQSLRNRDTARG